MKIHPNYGTHKKEYEQISKRKSHTKASIRVSVFIETLLFLLYHMLKQRGKALLYIKVNILLAAASFENEKLPKLLGAVH